MSHRASFFHALLPLLGLTLQACAPEEETPTPTAAPTPTATPVPDLEPWYQVSRIDVLPDGQGLDLDRDGSIDSALEATLDEIAARFPLYFEPAACGEEGCTVEEQIAMESIVRSVESFLTPESLEYALMKPLMTDSEALYFHQVPGTNAWKLRWSENPPAGDYLNHYVEAQEDYLGGTPRHYLNLQPNMAAEFMIGLPEEFGEPLILEWNFAPHYTNVLWTESSTSPSEQVIRMGGILDQDSVMEAFEQFEGGCVECIVDPCPDPCRLFYYSLDAACEDAFSADLDGNGDATIGMGLDITGQRL